MDVNRPRPGAASLTTAAGSAHRWPNGCRPSVTRNEQRSRGPRIENPRTMKGYRAPETLTIGH
jgi:hypothetical protein